MPLPQCQRPVQEPSVVSSWQPPIGQKGATTLHEVVRATTVQPGESIRYQTQTDNDNFNVLTATHHLVQKKTDLRVTSMDTGIADLLQRFQQNDIVELSEASEEKVGRRRQLSSEPVLAIKSAPNGNSQPQRFVKKATSLDTGTAASSAVSPLVQRQSKPIY